MNAPLQAQTKVAPSSPAAVSVVPTGLLQRKCACGGSPGVDGECAVCRKQRLQRQAGRHADPTSVPSIVHEVLRSSGQPLDPSTRVFMEPRFGHDFGAVRIHTDARAAESAQAVNALAYTVGQDVVFGAGQYAPGRTASRRLLAHELTHVVQQQGGVAPFQPQSLQIDRPVSTLEQEAERAADVAADGQVNVTQHAGPQLARVTDEALAAPPNPAMPAPSPGRRSAAAHRAAAGPAVRGMATASSMSREAPRN